MRSVQMLRSTQSHWPWLSPACLGKSVLAPVLPTVAGLSSVIGCLRAATFLRPLAPDGFPPFSATMDALTSAGRLFGPLSSRNTELAR